MNPDIFNGGDPNLLCSSTDYIFLFNDLDLRANINSFSEKSPGSSTQSATPKQFTLCAIKPITGKGIVSFI